MQRTHWPPTSKYPIKIKNILDCSQTQFWYCPSAFPAEKSAISPVNGLIKQRIIYLFRGREPLSMEKSIFHHHKLDVWRESRLQTFSVCLISWPLIKNIFFIDSWKCFILSASKLDGECIYTEQCQHHDQNAVCSEVRMQTLLINDISFSISRLTLALSVSAVRATPRDWCTAQESGEIRKIFCF